METQGIVGPIHHTKKFTSVEIFASITAGDPPQPFLFKDALQQLFCHFC